MRSGTLQRSRRETGRRCGHGMPCPYTPPVTFKLPHNGYASISEAALVNYNGMALQADGRRGFHQRLGHAEPVSYPFTLRYGNEEGKRLAAPAAIVGTITTPWRVVLVGKDLNALVNCDIVHNVSPPDKTLFPSFWDASTSRRFEEKEADLYSNLP